MCQSKFLTSLDNLYFSGRIYSKMVSTRGIRYKFSEGERVLCYEPDPTKAKVLYDSKVLEVIENKDKRGRRTVEYLIHFQGWNSSWDRCVSEDFVLKDTEENRQLQRDLAEKSQLQLGAYLYRRERKKTGGGPAKRARHGFSDDGSSSSTQPDGHFSNSNEEGEVGDTDSSGSSRSPPPERAGPAHLTLPSALRDRLTFDYHLVVKRGRLSRLPATPSAADILESFVKWFARAGAWHPARARHDPPQRPDLLDVSCRLNLVREVADGLRVYFDFVLRSHLLYKHEVEQYQDHCGRFIEDDDFFVSPRTEDEIKSELEGSPSQDESSMAAVEEDLKSPKIPEYAHLPPDPTLDMDQNDAPQHPSNTTSEEEEGHRSDQTATDANEKASEMSETADEVQNNGVKVQTRPVTRAGAVARRLRSHKSAVSQSENEEPAPSTSTTGEHRTFETLSSSVGSSGGSSLCEGCARAAPPPAPPPRNPLSQLMDKVAKWQIIPREDTEHLPCRVYGAIHLARLFVKLPEFLNATQMPDFKLKMVLKHIDMFVQYLEEHSEWFGEMYYISDNISRSH